MNSIIQKMARTSMLYLRMMYNASTYRQNKGRHHTVNEALGFVHLLIVGRPPPALLGDGREDDLHLRKLSVEILQVLLVPCDMLDALDAPEVISSTVDHQDIWHSSSSKAPMKEGEEVSPNHVPLAEPLDPDIQTKVGPDSRFSPCRMQLPPIM